MTAAAHTSLNRIDRPWQTASALRIIIRAILLIAVILPLSGCFLVHEPILTAEDGDPLPGGPGKFRLTKDAEAELEITIVQRPGSGHEYAITDPAKPEESASLLVFARLKDGLYLVQAKEERDTAEFVILAATADEKTIRFHEIEDEAIRNRLAERGAPVIKMSFLDPDPEKVARVAELKKERRLFAIDRVGLTLFGDRRKIARLAGEAILSGAISDSGSALSRIE
ncbi:MAG: hypothetical protein KDJ16_17525 [Hyphomicrobiales bacterium]|nr:hypothetical protein [Hyphomicrobiales bacterium]